MKVASRTNKLMVGAFVVMMIVFAIVALLVFADNMTFFKRSSRYFASFKSSAGLHIGAPLKMGGVEIGSVADIAISTVEATPDILLTLVVYAPNNSLLKTDSEASMETQGMLGDSFVNITTGSIGAPVLQPGSFLKTRERAEISAIVSQSTDIIKTVSETTTKLELFVDSLPDAKVMKELATDFRASSSELHALLVMLNAKDSALRTISDQATANRLRATLESLQSAASHIDSIANKVDGGQGTLGALVNDGALYDDVRKLMGRANRSKAAKYIIQKFLDSPEETGVAH